jgi:pilus assembly protein Flp/PilA
MRAFVQTLFHDKAGATAIEYALIASLIAVVIISGVTTLGTNLRGAYNNIANGVK